MTAHNNEECPGPHSRGIQPEVVTTLAYEPREIECGAAQRIADEMRGGDAA